ncbi:MAG: PTS-dependent dihydroxyacetone kinase phosphotransferase subunit DhaM [Caldilineaceae bacterium]|nr:PTS-dependent dihydroxyacetone kinase phosphotransferase subunit DhaM [Caldilineaceae bacterium]HRJ42136.1 dihydroxyacetone kinase phosphoryl donor subunit DhaM [Caldilineaceae bacterium]
MIGLVFVSHSRLIADGLCQLADQMAGGGVKIAPAGGLTDDPHALGTDAMLILDAIECVWSEDGVLLLVDMGSAVMSAEMALEFLPDEKRSRCTISNAPLVEGAIVAALHAGMGDSLHDVNLAAEDALNARKVERMPENVKREEQLGLTH